MFLSFLDNPALVPEQAICCTSWSSLF